ncbi:hypothetical protein [Micromonospora sp. NPDC005171]|uniref:hypothetical protein n=1 Tax=Micromonospora sp. NPDC005171 TaxID=3156866 RepID=UPI0033A6725C
MPDYEHALLFGTFITPGADDADPGGGAAATPASAVWAAPPESATWPAGTG